MDSAAQEHVVEMYVEHQIDRSRDRYPFCIVWTPLPFLSWFIPLIGHMGIAMSNGVIRDFGGPYYVAEDKFTFGRPTKYWKLDPNKCPGGVAGWDSGVNEASEIYKGRMHNICCDNCHSHVATALNIMQYKGKNSWDMVKLAFLMIFYGRYVSFWGFVKTWGPCLVIITIFLVCYFMV